MIIYQIYQLVGGFPAKFVSSLGISQNIFFHMIGNKSFRFNLLRGGRFQNWSIPLMELQSNLPFKKSWLQMLRCHVNYHVRMAGAEMFRLRAVEDPC